MSIYQDPRSLLAFHEITPEQRQQPATRAALAIHRIAHVLSNAGFDVHADTWQLYFHEPSPRGIFKWFARRRASSEIRAADSDSITIFHPQNRRSATGNEAQILESVALEYPGYATALRANPTKFPPYLN